MSQISEPIVGGRSIEGYSVGVLHLASRYPLPPGNPQHVQTFNFPVCFEAVNISDPWALMNGEKSIEPMIVEACEKLVTKGVRTIVGACGSFAYYQKSVADACKVPVFTSVLTQIPFLLQAIGNRKLGVLCASSTSVNERIYEACDIARPDRLVIDQMKGMSEFDRMLEGTNPMNVDEMEKQCCEAVLRMVEREPDIGGLVLQCSDLPPYGRRIQQCTGLPIFDARTLIEWAYQSSDYPRFEGLVRHG